MGQYRHVSAKQLRKYLERKQVKLAGSRYEFSGHRHASSSRQAELNASLDRYVTVGLASNDQISGAFKCDSSRLLALGGSTWRQWPQNPPPHPSPTQNLDNNELGANRSERLASRRAGVSL